MLYNFYRITGAIFYPLLVAVSPLFDQCKPNWYVSQRLGRYQYRYRTAPGGLHAQLIWIHAASVGEVQAAQALIAFLLDALPETGIFLTTMTRQGRAVACSLLPSQIRCELVPLDMPQAVARVLQDVQPDLYICLETELWPVMLTTLHKAGVPMLLLNGRISERSFRQYQRIKETISSLLNGFSRLAVITEQDRERFQHLGVPADRIRVCGNLKYGLMQSATGHDASGSKSAEQTKQEYSQLLGIQSDDVVFLCGSTRTGEEKLLLPVYLQLQKKYADKILWILAPRHLERLPGIMAFLEQAGLGYELFSQCSQSVAMAGKTRQENIILLDSIGELARLYAVGDYIFCGGSLVDKGGHNIMEPIAQRKPVFFGPFMQDFQDAVDLVLAAGAGVQVASPDELSERLLEYPVDAPAYEHACLAADQLAQTQQGAVIRQAEMVLQVLDAKRV
ncbi:3-deoxy-D-manno-octulosonic acid transferase [Candidatus Electrothrix sp.]|uniref:3-deoxy-D-manno-octulosonic acid transferase n=2 Tax=Candidatus Electrothrix sp. TaxID=2170559 RepID=UPI0040571976